MGICKEEHLTQSRGVCVWGGSQERLPGGGDIRAMLHRGGCMGRTAF